MAEHVGGGRGEDPLGVSLDRGVYDVARSVDTFGRNLKHAAMFISRYLPIVSVM